MSEWPHLLSSWSSPRSGSASCWRSSRAPRAWPGATSPTSCGRGLGVAGSLFSALLTVLLWLGFDRASPDDYQFVEAVPWLPAWGASYFVGVDGVSLLLIALTAFLTPIVVDRVHGRDRTQPAKLRLLRALPRDRGDRDLRLAEPLPVLRLPRGDAGADGLPDRHLGRARAQGGRGEVLPVHGGRLAACSWPGSSRSTSSTPSSSEHPASTWCAPREARSPG